MRNVHPDRVCGSPATESRATESRATESQPSFVFNARVGMATNAVEDAEAALRVSLVGRGIEEIEDVVHAVRNDPNRYSSRQNAQGGLARCLLAATAKPIVPYHAPVHEQPPMIRKSPSIIEVDVERLCDHGFFKPLGPPVFPEAPAAHHFSHMNVDHTVSGFRVGSEEEKAVVLIYKHLMYESKPQPPCKELPDAFRPHLPVGARGPFFTVREHNLKPPERPTSHSEVLIYGSTQLSKTPEAAASAWCAFFIDGCLPIMCVRNKGGANTGSSDMASGLEKLNKRVQELFVHEVRHQNIRLPETDSFKFRLQPRKTSDGEQIEFDINWLTLSRPQALIICMNPGQVKNLIGSSGTKATSKAGATAGLLDIMKGNTKHPYPPKCHSPYERFDEGANRPLARVYFILDEDDLNRSNASSVTEKLQFNAPPEVMKRLTAGLERLYPQPQKGAAPSAAGSSGDPILVGGEEDDAVVDDDDDDNWLGERDAASNEDARDREGFKTQMEVSGVRSAVRGVVALTATPAACGHDLASGASTVQHHICRMEHPSNYVGYEFTKAPYAECSIEHVAVPDRKQIVAIKKGVLYRELLPKYGWWNDVEDKPMPPFKMRADGAIYALKRELDDVVEEGEKSSRDLHKLVETAYKVSARKGDKVLESDGVGIALMLDSMSEKPAAQEAERRALIVSNYTRTNEQKIALAKHILDGDLAFEDGSKLPEKCVCDLFVIIFDHKVLRIMWRGGVTGDEEAFQPDHEPLQVIIALACASCWASVAHLCPLCCCYRYSTPSSKRQIHSTRVLQSMAAARLSKMTATARSSRRGLSISITPTRRCSSMQRTNARCMVGHSSSRRSRLQGTSGGAVSTSSRTAAVSIQLAAPILLRLMRGTLPTCSSCSMR